MRSTARRHIRAVLFCLTILVSSFASVTFQPTLVHADPACMANGGVYVVFVRGSGETLNDRSAAAFKLQLIGNSTTYGSLNSPPLLPVATAWVELGNEDG